ncbi:Metallo-hydrolase/oxidoreductase [Meredithblackwellia eburnea MCA 4105]
MTTTPSPVRSTRPSHHANDQGTLFKNPWPSASAPTWSELAAGGLPLGWAKMHLNSHPHARSVKVVKPDWGRGTRSASSREESPVSFGEEGGQTEKGERKSMGTMKVESVKNDVIKSKEIIGTWLGHASAYVELPWIGGKPEEEEEANGVQVEGRGEEGETIKVLFDPIFSMRAGPTQYTGPGRLTPSPCKVEDLPGLDIVCISHNHYDHLDLGSILDILRLFPKTHFFVPLGNKSWFLASGIPENQVDELDWWDDVDLSSTDLGRVNLEGSSKSSKLRITCVPAQHNSGRGARDQMTTLWSGWVLEHIVTSEPSEGEDVATRRVTRQGSIFFAGDTGYRRFAHSDEVCPVFEEIGSKFGPFDLSFIPIWRGGTLGFISWTGLRLSHESVPSSTHGTPSDAVSIHLDVKSRNTVAIHFGTFVGNHLETIEAVVELAESCDEAGLLDLHSSEEGPHGRMGVLDQGEALRVKVEEIIVF